MHVTMPARARPNRNQETRHVFTPPRDWLAPEQAAEP